MVAYGGHGNGRHVHLGHLTNMLTFSREFRNLIFGIFSRRTNHGTSFLDAAAQLLYTHKNANISVAIRLCPMRPEVLVVL